jgi:orotidine-5'-phosphate decarboxylase
VDKLQAAATARGGEGTRLAALDDLRKLDTSDSRKALEALTDAKDPDVALRALATIGRGDQAGGRERLKKVFEDAKRADVDRIVAFIAWGRLAAKDGSSWETLESYAQKHCSKDSALETALLETKAALFPATGGK